MSYDEFPEQWREGEGVTLISTNESDEDSGDDMSLGGLSADAETGSGTSEDVDEDVEEVELSDGSEDSEVGWTVEYEGLEEKLDELHFGEEYDHTPLNEVPNPGFEREGVSCTIEFKKGKRVLDFFLMVIGMTLIRTWVKYTNENMAKHFLGRPRKSQGKPCPPVEYREILAMLGIFLIVGVNHIRCLRDAWR